MRKWENKRENEKSKKENEKNELAILKCVELTSRFSAQFEWPPHKLVAVPLNSDTKQGSWETKHVLALPMLRTTASILQHLILHFIPGRCSSARSQQQQFFVVRRLHNNLSSAREEFYKNSIWLPIAVQGKLYNYASDYLLLTLVSLVQGDCILSSSQWRVIATARGRHQQAL